MTHFECYLSCSLADLFTILEKPLFDFGGEG
jgi:hypothetical protein